VTVLIVFVAAGAAYVQPANWTPFVPPAGATFGEYGAGGVFRAASVAVFAYLGFDSISTVAQEVVSPQTAIPIATLGSLALCTGLYIAVGLVLTGLVKYTQLDVPDPIAVGIDAAGPALHWLRPVVKIGAIAGLTSVIMTLLLGQSRIWFAIADDGLLPAVFARVHPRFKTPYVSVVLAGGLAATVAALVPIDVLGEMVSIGTLLAFVIVCVGVQVLRRRLPRLHRPFRTPCVPFVPVAGALTALLQMAMLPGGTWLRLVVWLAAGLAVYWFYGRKHAKPHAQRRAAAFALGSGTPGTEGSVAADTAVGDLFAPIDAGRTAGSGGLGRTGEEAVLQLGGGGEVASPVADASVNPVGVARGGGGGGGDGMGSDRGAGGAVR